MGQTKLLSKLCCFVISVANIAIITTLWYEEYHTETDTKK